MNIVRRILIALIDILRPALGPVNVCIYEPDVSCGDYAKYLFAHEAILPSFFKIAWRLLWCNPITAIWRILRFKMGR